MMVYTGHSCACPNRCRTGVGKAVKARPENDTENNQNFLYQISELGTALSPWHQFLGARCWLPLSLDSPQTWLNEASHNF